MNSNSEVSSRKRNYPVVGFFVRIVLKLSGKHMESLTLYGEGGTDFRPAFAYVDELFHGGKFVKSRDSSV